jgi:hypothetical protein
MNVMGLQSVMRDSTAEHVQNILQANIKILHEVEICLHFILSLFCLMRVNLNRIIYMNKAISAMLS